MTGAAAVIVFYEVANLVEGLHVRASMLSDSELDELQQRVKQEIGMICNNLVDVPLLMFNAFTASLFNHDQLLSGNLERVAEALNERLRAVTQKNLVVTNPEQPIRQVSVSKRLMRVTYLEFEVALYRGFSPGLCWHGLSLYTICNGQVKEGADL